MKREVAVRVTNDGEFSRSMSVLIGRSNHANIVAHHAERCEMLAEGRLADADAVMISGF